MSSSKKGYIINSHEGDKNEEIKSCTIRYRVSCGMDNKRINKEVVVNMSIAQKLEINFKKQIENIKKEKNRESKIRASNRCISIGRR